MRPPLDLDHCTIRELAATASWKDLLATLQATDPLTRLHCETLDRVYLTRVDAALWRRARSEDLLALSRHLSDVCRPVLRKRLDPLDPALVPRWLGLRDLVEHRLDVLKQREGLHVLARDHVLAILTEVCATQEIAQAHLESKFRLRPANLTRILNLMEDADLLRRSRVGKENLVQATEQGRLEQRRATSGESPQAAAAARSRKAVSRTLGAQLPAQSAARSARGA